MTIRQEFTGKFFFPISAQEVQSLENSAADYDFAALMLTMGFKLDRGKSEECRYPHLIGNLPRSHGGGIIVLSYDDAETIGAALDDEFPDPDDSVFTGNYSLDDKILALMKDLDIVYDKLNSE